MSKDIGRYGTRREQTGQEIEAYCLLFRLEWSQNRLSQRHEGYGGVQPPVIRRNGHNGKRVAVSKVELVATKTTQ